MTTPSRGSTADLVYASLYSGALASAALALFFLIGDTLQGAPFSTPSLVGSAVLLGIPIEAAAQFRLDVVALFSVVHMAAFVAFGTVLTLWLDRNRNVAAEPAAVALMSFAALSLMVALVDSILIPGLLDSIGVAMMMAGTAAISENRVTMRTCSREAAFPRRRASAIC